MRSKTTSQFRKQFAALPTEVQRQSRAAYRRFRQDPYHQSLRFKRVHTDAPLYSVRISKGYRAVGQREGDLVVWFWIGSHADYDNLLRRR